MSHFAHLRTQIVDKDHLLKALKDLGYSYQEGHQEVRGFGGKRIAVEIRVPTRSSGYDIGFKKAGETYELIADWWGIRDIGQHAFVQSVLQRYAYHAARDRLEEQGFTLVEEKVEADSRIHLVLRRVI